MFGAEVGITDSFFDLGGHSLLAAGLVFRANKRLNHKIWVYDLMQSPTPAGLSEIIATRSHSDQNVPAHLESHSRPNSRLTLVLVHGLWGQGSIFLPLVETLDKALDVLLLHDPFFGKPDCPNTVIEWAEFYFQDVLNQIPKGHAVVFGGYSFGGLIAFEMASLWRRRYGTNPASLILLDAAIYTPEKVSASDKENESELAYAMKVFGENQEVFVLDHFNKVAPLMCSSIQSAKHHGACLYLITPEAAVAGAADWWAARCPRLHTHSLPCSHQAVLGDSMIGGVSALINEHCHWVIESLDSHAF